jgi:hypothetical protein
MKTFKNFREDAPVNTSGGGNIAGTQGDPPVSTKAHEKYKRGNQKQNILITMLKRRLPT